MTLIRSFITSVVLACCLSHFIVPTVSIPIADDELAKLTGYYDGNPPQVDAVDEYYDYPEHEDHQQHEDQHNDPDYYDHDVNVAKVGKYQAPVQQHDSHDHDYYDDAGVVLTTVKTVAEPKESKKKSHRHRHRNHRHLQGNDKRKREMNEDTAKEGSSKRKRKPKNIAMDGQEAGGHASEEAHDHHEPIPTYEDEEAAPLHEAVQMPSSDHPSTRQHRHHHRKMTTVSATTSAPTTKKARVRQPAPSVTTTHPTTTTTKVTTRTTTTRQQKTTADPKATTDFFWPAPPTKRKPHKRHLSSAELKKQRRAMRRAERGEILGEESMELLLTQGKVDSMEKKKREEEAKHGDQRRQWEEAERAQQRQRQHEAQEAENRRLKEKQEEARRLQRAKEEQEAAIEARRLMELQEQEERVKFDRHHGAERKPIDDEEMQRQLESAKRAEDAHAALLQTHRELQRLLREKEEEIELLKRQKQAGAEARRLEETKERERMMEQERRQEEDRKELERLDKLRREQENFELLKREEEHRRLMDANLKTEAIKLVEVERAPVSRHHQRRPDVAVDQLVDDDMEPETVEVDTTTTTKTTTTTTTTKSPESQRQHHRQAPYPELQAVELGHVRVVVSPASSSDKTAARPSMLLSPARQDGNTKRLSGNRFAKRALRYVPAGLPITSDATIYCRAAQLANPENPQYLFADPTSCSAFFYCQYNNIATETKGVRTLCPSGQRFSNNMLTCVPAWNPDDICALDPCEDPDSEASDNQCWLDSSNCRRYYSCSAGWSVGKCCPPGQVPTLNCTCIASALCSDVNCVEGTGDEHAQTTSQPILNSNNTCFDSARTQLRPDGSNGFQSYDPYSGEWVSFVCPAGTSFDLQACSCLGVAPTTASSPKKYRQCALYLPFNQDFEDFSINQMWTQKQGSVGISKSYAAAGNGSAFFQGGRVEIEGFNNRDLGQEASWCLMYRCSPNPSDPSVTSCSSSQGTLLSNALNVNPDYSILIQISGSSRSISVETVSPLQMLTATSTQSLSSNAWHQICGVFDGSALALYEDGTLVQTVPGSTNKKRIKTVIAPYSIGSARTVDGAFSGYIDEVLVCQTVVSASEMEAHRNGNREALVNAGLIPRCPQRRPNC